MRGSEVPLQSYIKAHLQLGWGVGTQWEWNRQIGQTICNLIHLSKNMSELNFSVLSFESYNLIHKRCIWMERSHPVVMSLMDVLESLFTIIRRNPLSQASVSIVKTPQSSAQSTLAVSKFLANLSNYRPCSSRQTPPRLTRCSCPYKDPSVLHLYQSGGGATH